MKQYQVTVRAVVTKTYVIEAESEAEATATAHDTFSVLEDGTDENYEQDLVSVEEVK